MVEGTYGYIAPGENQDLPNYLLWFFETKLVF
jgi:hypothetical protein